MEFYIEQVLKTVNTVIIPGLGAFTLSDQNRDDSLLFVPYLKHDDGRLTSFIMEYNKITETDARRIIADFVQEVDVALQTKKEYKFEKIGRLLVKDGQIEFFSNNIQKEVEPILKGSKKRKTPLTTEQVRKLLSDREKSESLAALRADSSELLILEDLKLNVWWLNADEQSWEYKKDKVEYYPIKTLTKNDKLRTRNYFKQLAVGDLFLAYQKAPVKQLFGIYLRVPSDRNDDFAFVLLYEFGKKISWDELTQIDEFSNSVIQSMSAQGSAYKIEPNLFVEILKRATDIHFFAESLSEWIIHVSNEYQKNTFKHPFNGGLVNAHSNNIKLTRTEVISTDHNKLDSLGFTKDVQSLAALIALKEMKPPLAIALFGKWGSGKSFFMDCLEESINELSQYQGYIEEDGELFQEDVDDLFLKGIAHIKFNAWSYLDSNLWAGLVSTIFERLNQYLTDETKSNVARLIVQEKLIEQLKALNILSDEVNGRKKSLELLKGAFQKEIRNIEHNNQKLFDDEILDLINSDSELKKLHEELRNDDQIPQDLLTELKLDRLVTEFDSWKRFRTNLKKSKALSKYIILAIASISITVFINWYYSQFSGISWLSIVLFIGTPFGFDLNRLNKYKKVYKSIIGFRDRFNTLSQNNRTFEKAIDNYRLEIEKAEKEILLAEKHSKELDGKIEKVKYDLQFNLVDLTIVDFVKERSNHNDYKKNTGIVSIVRRDFELLSELFLSKENDESLIDETLFKEGKTLQRIVLYIDDLDRCTDEKVLEVLQAVHLLMAFPLFTVVVGVDERSVHNALKYQQLKRYQNIDKDLVDEYIKEIEPREYLEKIFQIPFQLPEASDEGVEQLINDIIPYPEYERSGQLGDIQLGDIQMGDSELIERGMRETPNEEPEIKDELTVGEANADYLKLTKTIKPEEIRITVKEKEYLQLFAPLVGNNPRTVKRYINIFRIVKTHELNIFNEVDSTLKIAFLIAFYTGKHRIVAVNFLKKEHDLRLNAYLSESAKEEKGKNGEGNLLLLIESMQDKEIGVKQILNMPKADHLKLFGFIERFSYKLDSQIEKK